MLTTILAVLGKVSPKVWAAIIGIAVLLSVFLVQQHKLTVAQRQAFDLALSRDSAEAAQDTTIHIVSGQLVVAQRRVVQEQVRNDSLDKALKETAKAKAQLELKLKVPQVVGQLKDSSADSSVRIVSGDLHNDAVDVHLEVAVPKPPEQAQASVQVTVHPITLLARLTCDQDKYLLHAARLSVEGPSWATIQLDSLVQDPGICNQQAAAKRHQKVALNYGLNAAFLVIGNQGVPELFANAGVGRFSLIGGAELYAGKPLGIYGVSIHLWP